MLKILSILSILSISILPTEMLRATKKFRGSKFNEVFFKFRDSKIVPEHLMSPPPDRLKVYFKNKTISINLGSMLPREYMKEPPVIEFPKLQRGFYTFIMHNVDAVAMYKQNDRNWRPYIVVNIPGSKKLTGDGEPITPYGVPAYPHYKPLTRVAFLVYEQRSNMSYDELRGKELPPNFHLENFASRFDLLRPLFGDFCWVREDFLPGQKVPTPTLDDYYEESGTESIDTESPISIQDESKEG
ncbi:putative odorant-binding protein A5 [Planococcus citri]|uniref:putative odorant-binding protein A5 n=1 Tax=Planococcus citri TaxID=170843 RepID=UPI0031F8CA14